MPFLVQLTADAARDLEDIYDDISQRHSPDDAVRCAGADRMGLQQPLPNTLTAEATPGNSSTSASASTARSSSSPYRITYPVMASHVYVLLDRRRGGRDMQTLLQRRLLQA